MTKSLEKLLALSSKVRMTSQQIEQQRRSFAYGSSKIENDRITREMVDRAAEKLSARPKG